VALGLTIPDSLLRRADEVVQRQHRLAKPLKVRLAIVKDTPGVLEHAEGWRISSQPTKVESNRQDQRSPETRWDQSSPAASRQEAAAGSQNHIRAAMNAFTVSTWC
jgi:hypothetical protein